MLRKEKSSKTQSQQRSNHIKLLGANLGKLALLSNGVRRINKASRSFIRFLS